MSFLSGLLPASLGGIPFGVDDAGVRVGRKVAMHEYPYRDKAWGEDLGRSTRMFAIRGFLADAARGNLSMLARDALLLLAESEGPHTFTHPTLGIFDVVLTSPMLCVESKEHLGVYEIEFECAESADPLFPTSSSSTGDEVSLGSLNLLNAAGTTFGTVLTVVGTGAAILAQAKTTLAAWAALPTTLALDAAGVMGAVTGLGDEFGRYDAGKSGAPAPTGSTEASLVAGALAGSAEVASLAVALPTYAATGSASTISAAVSDLCDATAACAADPGNRARILGAMADFTPSTAFGGDTVGLALTSVQNGTAALCRRTTLAALAKASAAYQPTSYDDAVALRDRVAGLLAAEALVAGDAGQDDDFQALRALRAAVVADLTARGATLANLRVFAFGASLPALVVAHKLYGDATREGEVIGFADPASPLFMPLQFQALSS